MTTDSKLRIFFILLFAFVGNIYTYSQTTTAIPNFKNLNEIKSFASSTKIIRGFDEYNVDEEIVALFHKDPALFVFKGDELDKTLYMKSQKYIEDKKYWSNLKQKPLCLQVNIKFNIPHGVTDAIRDFTSTDYTLYVASATRHYVSKTLNQKCVKLGGIYFPTNKAYRADLIDEKISSYSFKVPCKNIEGLISLRKKVNDNQAKNDVFKLVILYLPNCEREFKITSGPVYIQNRYTYYFGKALKAYLVYNETVIDDLTGLFSSLQSSIIDSTIIPAEKNYIINKAK